jgi:hypothetical protein
MLLDLDRHLVSKTVDKISISRAKKCVDVLDNTLFLIVGLLDQKAVVIDRILGTHGYRQQNKGQ